MSAIPLGSGTFGFSDGNAGHVCDLGTAPAVGDVDVLCVNSDTIVATPTGPGASWLVAPSSVGGQGAYILRRKATGGEGSTVTVVTSGDFDCQVSWSRWGNINAADDARVTAVGFFDTVTPAHTTAPLAEATELVIAFAALHAAILGSPPSAPVWSAGYTPLTANVWTTGGGGAAGYVAYKQPAGTAAETPSVSWTTAVHDRYMLTLTFTTLITAASPLFVAGPPSIGWSATAPSVAWAAKRPTIGWEAGPPDMQTISALSTVYVRCPVTSFSETGAPRDPTGDVVTMGFSATTAGPSSFQAAAWVTDTSVTPNAYRARTLITAGLLTPGTYGVWIKVTDNPEIPVIYGGLIAVV